jgi:MoaA/NifB/PqqE/SkfB family radical SAM enzyme
MLQPSPASPPARERRSFARKLPAVCDFSITNVCNAACDFCGFARDKSLVAAAAYADADRFAAALPILWRRGVRYMTLQGGEPLVHPEVTRLVRDCSTTGIRCAMITNGWFLSRHIRSLAAAGLSRLELSLDSADLDAHDRNRGLKNLSGRMASGIAEARRLGLPVVAVVTVNRLVDYERLPETLERLGFDAVSFSYPRREAFGSSSLVYGADSDLVDLDRDELLAVLVSIAAVKKRFPVFNPTASLAEVARFVCGQAQTIPCIGGFKYFYLDWNLDIWRCEAWDKPLGTVFDLDHIPDQREPCNACMMACYRNASMMMHSGIAAADAADALLAGDIGGAIRAAFRSGVMRSLGAVLEETPQLRRFARRRKPTAPASPRSPNHDPRAAAPSRRSAAL